MINTVSVCDNCGKRSDDWHGWWRIYCKDPLGIVDACSEACYLALLKNPRKAQEALRAQKAS